MTHDCPECGGACYCSYGDIDRRDCIHDCEGAVQEWRALQELRADWNSIDDDDDE